MVLHWVPWMSGWGWVFPLIGLLFMITMMFICFRMMGHMASGCMLSHGRPLAGDMEALRREVRELKDELQRLRPTR